MQILVSSLKVGNWYEWISGDYWRCIGQIEEPSRPHNYGSFVAKYYFQPIDLIRHHFWFGSFGVEGEWPYTCWKGPNELWLTDAVTHVRQLSEDEIALFLLARLGD